MEAVAGQPYSCPYLALHVQGKLACPRWSRLSGPLLLEHRLAAALGGAGCFVTWQTRHQSQCTAFILASLWSLSDASADDIDCRVFLFLVFRLWDISVQTR